MHTPRSNRLHITLFGRRNSGKSSLLNALAGHDVALVSAHPGTTTDPVGKAMEIYPLGACLLTDTAGFDDDEPALGEARVGRTLRALDHTDVALLLCTCADEEEVRWYELLKERRMPTVVVLSKDDLRDADATDALKRRVAERMGGEEAVAVSALKGAPVQGLVEAVLRKLPADYGQQTITRRLAGEGDVVLLVMPQDIQAPKGRLILPQVQTLRELLDKRCLVMCCTADGMAPMLQALAAPPKLIITDSQVFTQVYALKPEGSLLTSFSVLFAAYKGDIDYFRRGAAVIGSLTPQSRVLIAEACTHAPLTEDIGRVKLPRMLRSRVGEGLQIDIVGGTDFPHDLSRYDLVIHCGACMFNRRLVLSRVEQARCQQVPMTNYGLALATLGGIIDKIAF